MWRVQVANFHSGARHFHVRVGVKNLTKYFFAIYCSEMLQQFSPTL